MPHLLFPCSNVLFKKPQVALNIIKVKDKLRSTSHVKTYNEEGEFLKQWDGESVIFNQLMQFVSRQENVFKG